MIRLCLSITACAALVSLSAAAPAQDAPPVVSETPACTAPGRLPDALTAWNKPVPLTAATEERGLDAAMLTQGQAVTMALKPTPAVTYPVRPGKTGGSLSYGGLARFTVATGGTWRVALGSAAWVDVISGLTAMTSIAHGHGPDCTGVRKMVDYTLTPGTYWLQIAASAADSVHVLVTQLP